MILVIDNYDSFVHNLARYIRLLGFKTQTFRNNEITVTEVNELKPQAIVLSPGPCTPSESGICLEIVKQFGGRLPILGVCLGHQAIIQAHGGAIVRAAEPVHGRSTQIRHQESGVFRGLPSPMIVGRYHSLVGDVDSLPDCLSTTAWTDSEIIMAVQHQDFPIVGFQFHPESILTEHGLKMLENFFVLANLIPEKNEAEIS